jgi:hypothetical protein
MITQSGQINTTALLVPDIYVQIVAPPQLSLNGVPSNKLGIVGTASWGPVNSPVNVGNLTQAAAAFGPVMNRLNDLLTAVAIAGMQGANNFVMVRVTDGTDAAAAATVQGTCLTLTSKYTGSLGNQASVTVAAGTKAGTWKVTVGMPGYLSESFDNIGLGLAGNALWVAIAAAINNGTTSLRGPSNLIVAAAGAGTTAPSPATYPLAGGSDGVTTITGATLLGQDVVPRTGMYALRSTGASVVMLADLADSTTFSTQVAFGLSEAAYMVASGPSGDTIANAVTTKATAGIDSYSMKLMLGDWIYWNDTYNNLQRLVSPQSVVAGELAALSPQFSTLNKPLNGIVGTQKSAAYQQYSSADLQQLAAAGIDVVCNPSPGGTYFACRIGHNTSSNPMTNGDNYTRLTNYIATTINSGIGIFVGQLQTPTEQQEAQSTIGHYLDSLSTNGLIGNAAGTLPYSVEVDAGNNSLASEALGYQIATVLVQYQAIVEKFIVNLTGGTSVQVTASGNPTSGT